MSREPWDVANVAAPRHASNEDQSDELTFLDYLRTAGGHRPALPDRRESRDSTDRKRRHTGSESEPERRNYPYPTHHGRTTDMHGLPRPAMASGSSLSTAIDLTSSPERPQRLPVRDPRMQSSNDSRSSRSSSGLGRYGRRESDIVLPRWQPDNEVTKCPVCDTEFSLLYRRHHCRKCGRVVCNRCSPHRITIPRQYIVQPPNPYILEDEAASTSPLGGGDIVRVCNPCVPDPWTPDTNIAASTPIAPVPPLPNLPTGANTPAGVAHQGSTTITAALHNPNRYRSLPMPPFNTARSRSHTHQLSAAGHSNQQIEQLLASTRSIPPISARYHGHRYSQSNPPVHSFTPPQTQNQASRSVMARPAAEALMPPPAPEQSRPRRQIREEDECPVCGHEMQPGEASREAHIEECIATRFSSTPTQTAPRPVPAQQATGGSVYDTSAASASRPRTSSYRSRGMYKSTATEKDCVGADGEAKECVICLEDFEPGDELGTMECWCRFHRRCIRAWWDQKGAGSCPTHQLHD